MAQQTFLIHHPSGYQFRQKVPADLRKTVGLTEIRRSLKTGILSEAKPRARALAGLIHRLFQREETGISKPEAQEVVSLFFDSMADALAAGDRVELRGLCSFFVKEYGAYTGRNPRTGERAEIKPKKLPYFKCGKELKERLNR